ncbi:MAG: hypothetical protein JNN25_16540 [Candidatus Kapabacteria bacterium]|nr:hypothetical protein [Candidatus Kapabacteria bacterium]
MNAEQLFLYVIDSDATLTGEQRRQMHVMMLRLVVYPHLEKMLELQRNACANVALEHTSPLQIPMLTDIYNAQVKA